MITSSVSSIALEPYFEFSVGFFPFSAHANHLRPNQKYQNGREMILHQIKHKLEFLAKLTKKVSKLPIPTICHEKSLPDSLLTSRQNAHHGSDLSKLWIVLNVTSVSGRVQKILKTILSTSRLDGENEMFGISMLQL